MNEDFWRRERRHCTPTRMGVGWIISYITGLLTGWIVMLRYFRG